MAAKIIQFPKVTECEELTQSQLEKLEGIINKYRREIKVQDISIAEKTLKNSNCSIELRNEKEISGRDLTDSCNEPAFYNKTSRGLKKAWIILKDNFNEQTTMHDVMNLLQQYKIRTHYYCMMD